MKCMGNLPAQTVEKDGSRMKFGGTNGTKDESSINGWENCSLRQI